MAIKQLTVFVPNRKGSIVAVTDVLAKSKGSSNPHNLVKATILALSMMRDARTIAKERGISMEKVFKG